MLRCGLLLLLSPVFCASLTLRFNNATPAALPFSGRLSVGHWGACIVNATSGLTCWGSVDRTAGGDTAVPVTLPPQSNAPTRLISVGGYGTCVWFVSGTCACADTGQFSFSCSSPRVTQVAHGEDPFYIAVDTAGAVTVVGGASGYAPPANPLPTGTAAAVVAGWYHACVLSTAGAVSCRTTSGGTEATVPTALATGTSVRALAARSTGTCALMAGFPAGSVTCWWSASKCASNIQSPPASVQGTTVSIAAGQCRACAVNVSGFITCWGLPSDVSTLPAGLQGDVVAVEIGAGFACAVRASTAGVVCWLYITSTQFIASALIVPPTAAAGAFCDLIADAAVDWPERPPACISPSATPRATPTATQSATPSATPSPSVSQSQTTAPTPSASPSASQTNSETPSTGSSASQTTSVTVSSTSTVTQTSTTTPSGTASKDSSASSTVSASSITSPTGTVTVTGSKTSIAGGGGGAAAAGVGTFALPSTIGASVGGGLAAMILCALILIMRRPRSRRLPLKDAANGHEQFGGESSINSMNPAAVIRASGDGADGSAVQTPRNHAPSDTALSGDGWAWKIVREHDDVWYVDPAGAPHWTLPAAHDVDPATGLVRALPSGYKRVQEGDDVWFIGPDGKAVWSVPYS